MSTVIVINNSKIGSIVVGGKLTASGSIKSRETILEHAVVCRTAGVDDGTFDRATLIQMTAEGLLAVKKTFETWDGTCTVYIITEAGRQAFSEG